MAIMSEERRSKQSVAMSYMPMLFGEQLIVHFDQTLLR